MKIIPYGHQYIDKSDIETVVKVLKSDWITQGPKIKSFEDALCKYTGAKYAVAVSSGTAALHIACLAAGIKPGDEVITPAVTFIASSNCVLYCGGVTVFVDVQLDTANINPQKIINSINKRTKAIIAVHFAGYPCNLEAISVLARKHNLILIEDAAHALGAEYKGSKIGSSAYSDMAILSLHPVKSITTGEGGAVLTNKRHLYDELLALRNHGIIKDNNRWRDSRMKDCGWYYEMQSLGFNYRLTDIQAALGISQLKKLNQFIKKRREIATFYNRVFKDNPYFDIPIERQDSLSSHHLYPIRLKDRFKKNKKEIFSKMRAKGLGVQVHYMPVYSHPFYRKLGFKRSMCPVAEDFYQREISLPIYPSLNERELSYIIKIVFEVFKKLNKNE